MDNKRCTKCNGLISKSDEYAITLFMVEDLPSAPYYSHMNCPKRFAISE